MNDEKTSEHAPPQAPVDPTSDQGGASAGQPTQPTPPTAREVEADNRRLIAENAALRLDLDEARGVTQPKQFPCAVYRGAGETMEVHNDVDLSRLISEGWSETKG